jgi:hypothetical protein
LVEGKVFEKIDHFHVVTIRSEGKSRLCERTKRLGQNKKDKQKLEKGHGDGYSRTS